MYSEVPTISTYLINVWSYIFYIVLCLYIYIMCTNIFSFCRDTLDYCYLTCPFSPYWQFWFFILSFQKNAAKESLHFAATYWQPSGCIIVLANIYTAALWLLCFNQPAPLWSFIPSGWDFPPFTQISTSPIGSSHIPVVDVCHTSTKEESSCCIYYVYIYQGVYNWIILELCL